MPSSLFRDQAVKRPSTAENPSSNISKSMSPLTSVRYGGLTPDSRYVDEVRSATPIHLSSDINAFIPPDTMSEGDADIRATSVLETGSQEPMREVKSNWSVGRHGDSPFPVSVGPSQGRTQRSPRMQSDGQRRSEGYDQSAQIDLSGQLQHSHGILQIAPGLPQGLPHTNPSYHPIPPGVPQGKPQGYPADLPPGIPEVTPQPLPSGIYMNGAGLYSPYVLNITPSQPQYPPQWTNDYELRYYPFQSYSRVVHSLVPENPGIHKEGPPGANLFIYHLPVSITDSDLKTLFTACGNIVSAKVFIDKQTGKSKGFGFVSYDSAASAQLAIETMNGFKVDNKVLKVTMEVIGKE